MNILTKAKLVLTNPTKFFKIINKEKGITPAFAYLMILGLFSSVMTFAISLLFKPIGNRFIQSILGTELPSNSITLLSNILNSIWGYILSLAIVFIVVAILYLWIKIFRGKGDYKKTYQIYVYGSTPSFLLSWIPIIGGFAWIYEIILLITGTSILHKISKTKSILIYIIPMFIVAILVLIGIFILVTLISAPIITNILTNITSMNLN